MPLGQKIKMYYDSLGRVVKTINPDKSEQRVVYGVPTALNAVKKSSDPTLKSFEVGIDALPTPWENYAYDANDLAPKTHSASNVPTEHHFTPKSSMVDALGRTIKTTEHNAHDTGTGYENVVMQYNYDIRGNLLSVKDPYNKTVFEHVYDLRPAQKGEDGQQEPLSPLKTKHIDKGESTILFDATGKSIEGKDAKGAQTLSSYDKISRPVKNWARNKTGATLTVRSVSVYGDASGTGNNVNGKPIEISDEAGKLQFLLYDFKGNLLTKQRSVIDDSVLRSSLNSYTNYVINWDTPPTLSGMAFTTDMVYDALNRITELTLPTDLDSRRKKIIPGYNTAGALEKVDLLDPVLSTPVLTNYVENIAYNAKGQRILIAFGNNVMTRYAYDERNFRLLRQRSEKYTKNVAGTTITYNYASGLRQDEGFNYDLVGNIVKLLDRMTDSGIGSPDALDREFEYDPLYRLTYADGRESNTQNGNSNLFTDAAQPIDFSDVRAYSRTYTYDKLGNVQNAVQAGTYGFTRHFEYNTGQNTLKEINDGGSPSNLVEDFTYDACGNQITSGASRQYTWNHADQLICYKNKVGTSDPTIYAQYDYAGQDRVSKLVRTGTAGSPIYERTIYIDGIFEYVKYENVVSTAKYEKNYIHIMDDKSRIAEFRIDGLTGAFPGDISNKTVYILESQIGSSVMRVSNTGTEIDREEYYPFGDSSLRTFTYKRYRYVGKERDAESGLYYYGARYYAAWTCRFISVDPLAADYPFYTPYNYAGNKPINKIDIDGMQEEGGAKAPVEPVRDAHQVKAGENLWSIAKAELGDKVNNIKILERVNGLIKINNLDSKGSINKDQTLFLESKSSFDNRMNTYNSEKKAYDRKVFETFGEVIKNPANQNQIRPGSNIDKDGNFFMKVNGYTKLMDAALSGADVAIIEGGLKDFLMVSIHKFNVNDGESFYGNLAGQLIASGKPYISGATQVRFGSMSWTQALKDDRTAAFTSRNGRANYFASYDKQGNIKIEINMFDTFDVKPDAKNKDAKYNGVARFLEPFHKASGANINMQIRASWSLTIKR